MSHTTSLHTFSLLRLCPYSQGPERNRTVTVGPRRCHDTPYFVASHHCSVHPKTCLRPGLNYAPHTGSGMREQNFDTRFTHPSSMRTVLHPDVSFPCWPQVTFSSACGPWKVMSLQLGVLNCKPPHRPRARPGSVFQEHFLNGTSMAWLCHGSTFHGGFLSGALPQDRSNMSGKIGKDFRS